MSQPAELRSSHHAPRPQPDGVLEGRAAVRWRDALHRVDCASIALLVGGGKVTGGEHGHDGAWLLYVVSIAISAELVKKKAGRSR